MILNYAYGYDETVAKFVADLIPAVRGRGFGNCTTIGIVEGNMLIAGLVYHEFNPEAGTIEISGAALPGHYWLTRETLKRMYQYPFLGCRCQMVIQRVPAEDERQLRMMAVYGYSFIRIPRALGRDRDGVLCLLTREDWEANRFNKRLQHHIGVEPTGGRVMPGYAGQPPISPTADGQRNSIAQALMQIQNPPPQMPPMQGGGMGMGMPQMPPPGAPPQGTPVGGPMPPPQMPLSPGMPPMPQLPGGQPPPAPQGMPQGMPPPQMPLQAIGG